MMVISREHEINSHIGSGYDLWRNDNVTRDGEGLYRFHSEDHLGYGSDIALMDNYGVGANAMMTLIKIVLNLTLKLPKHFPMGNSPKNMFLLPPKNLGSTFLWEEETSRLLTSLAAANSSKPWSVFTHFMTRSLIIVK